MQKENNLADVPSFWEKNWFYTCGKYSEQWFAKNFAKYFWFIFVFL